MKHTSGIYLITNTINGMQYVGQSVDMSQRWSQHKTTAKNIKETADLYQAMREYGIDNFTCEVLEECSKKQLNEREIYWIDYYDTFYHGYNMTRGGQGKDGWKYDPEEIKYLWDIGLSVKEIMDALGCSQQLVSERLIGYKDYNNETARARNQAYSSGMIYQYSLLGQYIQSFLSATIAAKEINHSRNDTILACLRGQITSAYGFQWSRKKLPSLPPVAAPHSKLVQCIETGELFISTKEAAKTYNLKSHSNIVECISGKKKSAGKHKITGEKLHWKYIES